MFVHIPQTPPFLQTDSSFQSKRDTFQIDELSQVPEVEEPGADAQPKGIYLPVSSLASACLGLAA